jgi:hypothetical protein
MTVKRLISGGQTGADQSIITVGRSLNIPVGGTIPKGWRTDDGPCPDLAKHGFVEHRLPTYPPRTLDNVCDSDGTLIFGNVDSRGSRLTLRYCVQAKKPCIVVEWRPGDGVPDSEPFVDWLASHDIGTLNVAGNRERSAPGIGAACAIFITRALGEK